MLATCLLCERKPIILNTGLDCAALCGMGGGCPSSQFGVRAFLLFVLSILLLPSTLPTLRADGGDMRLSRRQGDFGITVFTSPNPLRAGPVDISVLIQDARTGLPVLNAPVTVRATPLSGTGEPIVRTATSEAATNKLFRAAVFDLPSAGKWEIEVQVEGQGDSVRVRFEVDAAQAASSLPALGSWLAWPVPVILLFAVHQWLVRRRKRAQQVGRIAATLRGEGAASAKPQAASPDPCPPRPSIRGSSLCRRIRSSS